MADVLHSDIERLAETHGRGYPHGKAHPVLGLLHVAPGHGRASSSRGSPRARLHRRATRAAGTSSAARRCRGTRRGPTTTKRRGDAHALRPLRHHRPDHARGVPRSPSPSTSARRAGASTRSPTARRPTTRIAEALRRPLRRRVEPQPARARATCSARRATRARHRRGGRLRHRPRAHAHRGVRDPLRAARALPPAQRPAVIYTAHGFHFYEGGAPLRQRALPRDGAHSPRRGPTTSSPSTARTSTRRARFGGIAPGARPLHPGHRRRHRPLRARRGPRRRDVAASATELERRRRRASCSRWSPSSAPVKRHALALEALARVQRPARRARARRRRPARVAAAREGRWRSASPTASRWAGYRRDIPAVLAASDALAARAREREGLNRSRARGDGARAGPSSAPTRAASPTPSRRTPAGSSPRTTPPRSPPRSTRPPPTRRRSPAAARPPASAPSPSSRSPRIIDAYEELYREALASRV